MGFVPLRPSSWLTPGPPGRSREECSARPQSRRPSTLRPEGGGTVPGPRPPSPPTRLLLACASAVTSSRGWRAGPGPLGPQHTPVTGALPAPRIHSGWAAFSARGLCPIPVPSVQCHLDATFHFPPPPVPPSRYHLLRRPVALDVDTGRPHTPSLPALPLRALGPSWPLSQAGLPEHPGCSPRHTSLQALCH